MTKLSKNQKNELKILTYLAKELSYGYATYFKTIARNTRISQREVRLACRSMARKGWTEYMKGLFDEEGYTAGSGYGITEEGVCKAFELGLITDEERLSALKIW